MKFGAGHSFADPEAAARRRSLAASSPINDPFLYDAGGTGSGFRTGTTFAVERDWITAEHGMWGPANFRVRSQALSVLRSSRPIS